MLSQSIDGRIRDRLQREQLHSLPASTNFNADQSSLLSSLSRCFDLSWPYQTLRTRSKSASTSAA